MLSLLFPLTGDESGCRFMELTHALSCLSLTTIIYFPLTSPWRWWRRYIKKTNHLNTSYLIWMYSRGLTDYRESCLPNQYVATFSQFSTEVRFHPQVLTELIWLLFFFALCKRDPIPCSLKHSLFQMITFEQGFQGSLHDVLTFAVRWFLDLRELRFITSQLTHVVLGNTVRLPHSPERGETEDLHMYKTMNSVFLNMVFYKGGCDVWDNITIVLHVREWVGTRLGYSSAYKWLIW